MPNKIAHPQKQHLLIPLFVLALVLLAWPTHTAHAATRTVEETGTDSGDCTVSPCATITYAIGQATGGDTINVAAGTYTEAGINVNKDLTITGTGADVTIVQAAATAGTDGTGNSVFLITSGMTAVLENMTIRHGNIATSGGGIHNDGTLTVNNATIANNSADFGGGGIYNAGTLTVNNATISNNSADFGGGIDNYDRTVTVNNVTISNNSADFGGGIRNFGTLTVNSATISNNSAGIIGGGIGNFGGTAYILHTIISGNTTSFLGPDCEGTINSQGYNLIGNTADCTINGDTTGNITEQSADLGPLQDNGGPTLTHALLTGSPAIDQIPTSDPDCNPGTTADQRGAVRADGTNTGGSACDIGAFEFDSGFTPTAVTGLHSTADAAHTSSRLPLLLVVVMGLGTAVLVAARRRNL